MPRRFHDTYDLTWKRKPTPPVPIRGEEAAGKQIHHLGDWGVRFPGGAPVFNTGERRAAPLASPIPVHLRQQR